VIELPKGRTYKCPNCGGTNVILEYYETYVNIIRRDPHGILVEEELDDLPSDEKYIRMYCTECGEESREPFPVVEER